MPHVDLKLEFYGGRGWLYNAFAVWAQGPTTGTQKTKKITNFGGIPIVLVVPLLGFIFLKMRPVAGSISGTSGLAQEMGHPYVIWLEGAQNLNHSRDPNQSPKPTTKMD